MWARPGPWVQQEGRDSGRGTRPDPRGSLGPLGWGLLPQADPSPHSLGCPLCEQRDQKLAVGALPVWPPAPVGHSATLGARGLEQNTLPLPWALRPAHVWGQRQGQAHCTPCSHSLSQETPVTVTFGGGWRKRPAGHLQPGRGAGEVGGIDSCVAACVSIRQATCCHRNTHLLTCRWQLLLTSP